MRRAALQFREPRRVRLLLEAAEVPAFIEAENPHLRRVGRRDRLRRNRDVGARLDVRVDELAEIHAIQMIAREDQIVVRVVSAEMPRGLAHGVGRALKPVGAVGGLFGGEDLHESFREQIEPVGLRDVSVERRGVELRQHENALEPRMEAVADRDIDQPIFAANRHGRLRTHVRERKQPRAASAAEDERENIRHEAI